MLELKTNGGITWLESEMMRNTGMVEHAFATRLGGVSHYPWRGLNVGLHSGDDLVKIQENRIRLMRRFAIEPEQVVSVRFLHSNHVIHIDENDESFGFLSEDNYIGNGDAVITARREVALFVTYADCVPILILDPEKKVVAAVHAGWRGTISGILLETVKQMMSRYHSRAEDFMVAIGPHIRQDDFEVGSEVIEAVKSHSGAWLDLLRGGRPGHAFFNLEKALRWQLQSLGISANQISSTPLSTFQRHDLFFSHRRSNGPTGRMGAFILLT